MKLRRNNNFLIEPASAATGDIAFNLIVFFLVCASTQPDSGRKQILPRSENQQKQTEQTENLEVSIDRNSVSVNTEKIPLTDFPSRIKRKLQGKAKPEDRIVVVKSTKDVPYHHWIAITGAIEEGGGVITLQLEEERNIQVP